MRIIRKGATSQSVYVSILDSTSTTGGRKTGLAYNTASLTAYYTRNGGSATAITLATLAAANSAWSSGGFKEVDATNAPGLYRLDVPDAALASGADSVVVTLNGASGMVQVDTEIQLVAWDPQDTVRGGLTALPNANAEASGGLYTRGSGAGQINQPANGMIDANVVRNAGTAITAASGIQEVKVASIAADAITASAIAADAIGSSELAAGAASEIASAVRTELTTELGRVDVAVSTRLATSSYAAPLDAAGTRSAVGLASANLDTQLSAIAGYIDTEVGAIYNRIGAPAGASIAADIAAVQADADDIQTRLPAALVSGRIDASVGAMAANVLTASAIATDAITAGKIAADAIGASELATDAAAEIASAVRTELATELGRVDATVSSRAPESGGNVAAIKAATDKLDDTLEDDGGTFRFTANALEQAPTGGSAPSAADIANAVLDELLSGHATAGSLGKAVSDILAAVDTEVAAIKAKTDNLPSDPADASDIAASFSSVASSLSSLSSTLSTVAGYVDTEVAAIKAKTDALPSSPAATSDIPSAAAIATQVRTELTAELANLDAAVSTRATPAQVNTEVVDALATDTYPEPGQGAPPATASLATKLGYTYKGWRNKRTQDGTTEKLFADDGSTVDQKATVSDDGSTFTKGEVVAGP